MNLEIKLRPDQEAILRYQKGKMGIAAVPGSGKTFTLSLLAADLIRRGALGEDQEILVVTLVNSAVDNFYQRVSEFIQRGKLLPNIGYRVRTLHGLAHDIVRERPELAGLDTNFQILDERDANDILDMAVSAWLKYNPNAFDHYLKHDLSEYDRGKILRADIPKLATDIARNFIRYSKDLRKTPEMISARLEELGGYTLPLMQMSTVIYKDYERALAYRGAVDFDDLIRLGLEILSSDQQMLERLRFRWPYILEDEAQDSSHLQEEILSLLVGENGNWVRVGDPNQAIYETFTTANPKYLNDFIVRNPNSARELRISGRSSKDIINLANQLVTWTSNEHPEFAVRDALKGPPFIHLTEPGDPQPNPPSAAGLVFLSEMKYSAHEEIQIVANSIQKWLPKNPHATVAVLVPRNHHAIEFAEELKKRKIPFTDSLLKVSNISRASAELFVKILRYLSDPQSSSKLADVFRRLHQGETSEQQSQFNSLADEIRKIRNLEDYIWPAPGKDWIEGIASKHLEEANLDILINFRGLIRRWMASVVIPVDQLILTLAQDTLHEPTQLAIAHKLAMLLRSTSLLHPSWRMNDFSEELDSIATNQRRFLGFAEDDTGFKPENYKGKVVISTVHKAKGLEWDRVYLMSVNNYDFPSGMAADQYQAEKWFYNYPINLEAETLAQLDVISLPDQFSWVDEGEATLRARLDYVRERLRLFYVGITRAKSDLIVTWNSGRRGEAFPAAALVALIEYKKMQSQDTIRD
jgi:DNA helicase-2/ATP-dependent DNA helicase PcrA